MTLVNRSYDFATLKEKHRAIREQHEDRPFFNVRIHRALSWLKAAEEARDTGNPDAEFVFLWISFNAAYGARIYETIQNRDGSTRKKQIRETETFARYFENLVALDGDGKIARAIRGQLEGQIQKTIRIQHMYKEYWDYQRNKDSMEIYDNWQGHFDDENASIKKSIREKTGTAELLCGVFKRLYELRNQLVHGGATYSSRENRQSVENAVPILAFLVPVFINLMIDNPEAEWARLEYPEFRGAPDS